LSHTTSRSRKGTFRTAASRGDAKVARICGTGAGARGPRDDRPRGEHGCSLLKVVRGEFLDGFDAIPAIWVS